MFKGTECLQNKGEGSEANKKIRLYSAEVLENMKSNREKSVKTKTLSWRKLLSWYVSSEAEEEGREGRKALIAETWVTQQGSRERRSELAKLKPAHNTSEEMGYYFKDVKCQIS